MTTFYLDYENGNDNYGGTSFSVLASGTDGAISSTTFSSATANFPNDNTIAPLKNILWYGNFLQGYGSYAGYRLLSLNYVEENITGPSGIDSYIYYLQEYPNSAARYCGTNTTTNFTINNNTNYTASLYVKANGRNKIVLTWTNTAAKGARFNLANGTVEATGANATAAISDAGGGWYRVSISITSSASAASDTFSFATVLDDYTGTVTQTFTGDSTKGIYITGLQIEASSSATTYERPPGQILSIFNGTLYAYYHIIERLSSTTLSIAALSGGTALANTSARQYYIGGRIQTFTNGLSAARLVSGDIVRIEASPDPTSIGNATWDGSGSRLTVAISSSTNTTPIAITTSTSHGYSTGDTVFICDHTTNTNANGTWEITVTGSTTFTLTGSTGNGVGGASGTSRKATNCVVRLASALTENIASHGNQGEGRTAWTATANNSTTTSSATKQGNISDSISIGATFTTGLVAYKSFSTKDLSGYQQLSFFILQTAGTVATSGQLQLKLCSDTAGATAVNTFNIPALGSINTFHVFTVNLGVNLGNNIQSIGLYTTADAGAQTFLLSNIIACKASSSADSLSLTSLIGKNTTNQSWYPIQSIVGTRIIIDGRLATNPNLSTAGNFPKGYYETAETITTYKRETIKTPPQSAAANLVHTINDGASVFTPNIIFEGGYDRTNMSTQSGITFFDGQNGLGYGIYSTSKSGFSLNKIGCVRYDRVYLQNGYFLNISNFYSISCTNAGLDAPTNTAFSKFQDIYLNNNYVGFGCSFGFNRHNFTNCYFLSNNLRGMDLNVATNIIFNNCYWNNNGSQGLLETGGTTNITFNSCSFNQNQGEAIRTAQCGSNIILNNCTTTNISFNAFYSFGGSIYLNNCLVGESAEFGIYPGSDGRIYCTNHDNTANNWYIYTDYGMIRPQTSVRYSNTGYAWSMSPNNDYRKEDYPLGFPIGQVAVSANSLVTIKAWMRRNNLGLTMRLRVKGGQIAGVSNDVIVYMTSAADTWEQVTLTFTPTESGVVELLAECWGGTSYTGYIDDLTITQV